MLKQAPALIELQWSTKTGRIPRPFHTDEASVILRLDKCVYMCVCMCLYMDKLERGWSEINKSIFLLLFIFI